MLQSVCRRGALLPALLVLVVSLAGGHAADNTADVGSISEIEGTAAIISNGQSTAAANGAAVHLNDALKTGAGGHVKVTFRDSTVLTLGENASVVVDRYVYDPQKGVGDVLLTTTQGAFRFATGKMKELSAKTISVSTPVADIGVRGTEFWGGLVDGKYSVLLLTGEVNVKNEGGTVLLNSPGLATVIGSRLQAPLHPTLWSLDKIQHALTRTVTREGLKQLERELHHFKFQGLPGKDQIPGLIKPKELKPKAGQGGWQNLLRHPNLPRFPW
jgi:hypothetical protein